LETEGLSVASPCPADPWIFGRAWPRCLTSSTTPADDPNEPVPERYRSTADGKRGSECRYHSSLARHRFRRNRRKLRECRRVHLRRYCFGCSPTSHLRMSAMAPHRQTKCSRDSGYQACHRGEELNHRVHGTFAGRWSRRIGYLMS
jgi:hypothetical protein